MKYDRGNSDTNAWITLLKVLLRLEVINKDQYWVLWEYHMSFSQNGKN